MANLAHKNLVPNPKEDVVIGNHSIHFPYAGGFGMRIVREYWNDDAKDPECGGYFMEFWESAENQQCKMRVDNFSADDLFAMSKALHQAGNYIMNKEMGK